MMPCSSAFPCGASAGGPVRAVGGGVGREPGGVRLVLVRVMYPGWAPG